MPFFYSQYLVKDDKKSKKSALLAKPSSTNTNNNSGTGNKPTPPSSPSSTSTFLKRGTSTTTTKIHAPPTQDRRLVWHSNIGASGKRNYHNPKATTSHNPFQTLFHYGDRKKRKVVHFSTIEIQHFRFDWNLADQVFYSRSELAAMGEGRFEDAATLRAQRVLGRGGSKGLNHPPNDDKGHTLDDATIAIKSKDKDIAALLNLALDDPDLDENISIRGIEHFVYPDLQQEMIRRKKELQREVLEFARSSRPDPQGWRLADHSRFFSLWARTVAVEKAMKYYLNNAAEDPEVGTISRDELDRIQRSGDELETSTNRLRRGSSIVSLVMSQSYEGEERSSVSSSSIMNNIHPHHPREEKDGSDVEGIAEEFSRFGMRKSSSDSLESAPTIEEEEEEEEDDEGKVSVFQQIAQSKITWENRAMNMSHSNDTQPAGSETGED